ncbi:endonuclease III [archaeon]|jgi:endonuclease III|nr:endonuclease III [archaeon]MBT4241901.1 endonuclease III [archaeon]MBT4418448.1 endonuclease III [archaeon]
MVNLKHKEYNSIPKIIQTLEKEFYVQGDTTLNRMRQTQGKDPFKILISCLLSLRSKDETTEKISRKLFQIADTPQKIIQLPTEKLEKIIFSTGHYRKKAQTLKHVSNELINNFNNKVPDTKEELLSIKGIGPKTANIVLNFAYDQPTLPIDTHCHRIPNRLGWVKTKTPEQTEIELEKILPKKYWKEFNGIFVSFGRRICLPISPLCSQCPINNYCPKINVIKSR